MDEVRRVRFLIPPLLFMASLLRGAWCSGQLSDLSAAFPASGTAGVVLLIAGGGAGTIAAGYVFGTVTYFALRVCFRYRRHPGRSRFHEAAFSGATINAVWKKLGRESSQEEAAEAALYGVVAFDHGVLREEFPGIHEWLVRRWTGFAVAAISAIALLFSFEMGLWIGIHPSVSWLLPWGVFTVVLVGVAWSAQRDGERMIRFMAEKPPIRHLKSQSDARSVAVRSDLR